MSRVLHYSLVFFSLLPAVIQAQDISPQAVSSAGAELAGAGISVTWTLGQIDNIAHSGGDYLVTEGFNQPACLLPLVEAGAPLTICSNAPVLLENLGASIQGVVTDGEWLSSGTGIFEPAASFSVAQTYRPSVEDKENGSITFTLRSDPAGPCGSAADEVTIHILLVNCGVFPWNGSGN